MLVDLLRRVDAAGTVHLEQLADDLGVTVEVVRHMLADLTLRGLLKPMGGECTTRCGGCAFASSCHGNALETSWQLTASGRAAAGRLVG